MAFITPLSIVAILGSILVNTKLILLALLGTNPRFNLYVSPLDNDIRLSLELIDNSGTGITLIDILLLISPLLT